MNLNLIFGMAALLTASMSVAQTSSKMAVEGKMIEFKARTNMSSVEVKGVSKTANGSLEIFKGPQGLKLKNVTIKIPVESLKTGMSLRDKHMKEKIFTASNGTVPDITFQSHSILCAQTSTAIQCKATGLISLRGKSIPAVLPITLKANGAGYVALAQFNLKLSDFGIQAPKYFGVEIQNKVSVMTQLVGTPSANVVIAQVPEMNTGRSPSSVPSKFNK